MPSRKPIEEKLRPATSFKYNFPLTFNISAAISVSHSNKIEGVTNDLEFFFANNRNLKKTEFFRNIIFDKLSCLTAIQKKNFNDSIKKLLNDALCIDGVTPGLKSMSDFCRTEMIKRLNEGGYEAE